MPAAMDIAGPEILVQYEPRDRCFELSIPLPRATARPRAHADSLYFFQTALYAAYRAYEEEGREFPAFHIRIAVDDLRARATGEALKVLLTTLIQRLRSNPAGTRLHETTVRRRKPAGQESVRAAHTS